MDSVVVVQLAAGGGEKAAAARGRGGRRGRGAAATGREGPRAPRCGARTSNALPPPLLSNSCVAVVVTPPPSPRMCACVPLGLDGLLRAGSCQVSGAGVRVSGRLSCVCVHVTFSSAPFAPAASAARGQGGRRRLRWR